MIRVGFKTNTIYPNDYDFSKCPECCFTVSETNAANKEYIAMLKLKGIENCLKCGGGCPESLRGIKNGNRI